MKSIPSRKSLLNDSRLYLILDTQVNTYDELMGIVKDAVRCGVDIVQLRNKIRSISEALSFAREAVRYIDNRLLFIMNDRVDLALLSGSHGVHVGQDDLSVGDARSLMGPDAVIGTSCQNLEQALRAQDEGADYIGFGSVFKTQTKPERSPMDLQILKQVLTRIQIPVFPIGGICLDNVGKVVEAGAKRVAVCRDVCLASDRSLVVEGYHAVLNPSQKI